MEMRNGQRVATDSIILRGQPFPVILPNQSHKHFGVRMAIDGNFLAEKEHVRSDMEQLLNALAEERVLTQKEKERAFSLDDIQSLFLSSSSSSDDVVVVIVLLRADANTNDREREKESSYCFLSYKKR